jgi:hypothetical protein
MKKTTLLMTLILLCIVKTFAQEKTYQKPLNTQNSRDKKIAAFIGIGNTSLISDYYTLTDKSFVGELNWQIRGGVKIYDNYEINFGIYGRQFPDRAQHAELSFNKFLGYSGAFVYEFREPDSRWGIPIGFEVLSYKRNITINYPETRKYEENYKALAYGPKIGARFHISDKLFLESELNVQYEQYKHESSELEKPIEANTIGCFKFLNISVNRWF